MPVFSRSSKIDPREAFVLWVTKGDLNSAAEEMRRRGKINLIRRRPFSRQSIWNAAVNYMMYNWDDCKPYLPINSPEDEESWDRVITMKILNMSRRKPRDAAMLLDKYGFWEYARDFVENDVHFQDLADFLSSHVYQQGEE